MYVRNVTDVQKSLRTLHFIVIKKSILKTYKKLKKIFQLFICWSRYTKKNNYSIDYSYYHNYYVIYFYSFEIYFDTVYCETDLSLVFWVENITSFFLNSVCEYDINLDQCCI